PDLWSGYSSEPGTLGLNPVLAAEENGWVFDLGSEMVAARRAQAAAADRAESVRLTYVALTRARLRSYVVWGLIGRDGDARSNTGLGVLLSSATGETTREAVDELALKSNGAIDVRAISEAEGDALISASTSAAPPPGMGWVPPAVAGDQLRSWRTGSFSSMVAHGDGERGRDHADPPLPALPAAQQSPNEPQG